MPRRVLPYGSWPSAITAAIAARGGVGLGSIQFEGDDVYWVEARPTEGGRCVVVHRDSAGTIRDVTPPPFSVRTRVHEYGGLSYVVRDATLYFSNYVDQRLYRQRPGQAPEPLTPPSELRYGDPIVDASRRRLICVLEDHTGEGEAVNSIAAVPMDGGVPVTLASGNDFYSNPRLSPDGRRLLWVTWNHPSMSWDASEIQVAEVNADGSLGAPVAIAGGPAESVLQPEWGPDGAIYFTSDRSGWWNLYRHTANGDEALVPAHAEFALPNWILGTTTYGFIDDHTIACSSRSNGVGSLSFVDTTRGAVTPCPLPFSDLGLRLVAGPAGVFVVAASPEHPRSIVRVDRDGTHAVLRSGTTLVLDPGEISHPEQITFPTAGGAVAHGIFFPPTNAQFSGPDTESPPLIVGIHGGPTAEATDALSIGTQYWTNRGFGVLQVNHRGSTGYGRDYREQLKGAWGIADVEDCVHGARYLAQHGRADPARLLITGGSAGGFTTLAAAAGHDVFAAGASHFGVADLGALARDTHKFESQYLTGLVGGGYPERKDLYDDRSPINHVGDISCPLIVLQGDEDRIVPKEQAEQIVSALRAKHLPVAYVLFAGEQHGWRMEQTIITALESELSFYGQVLGFDTPGVRSIAIENLGAAH